MGRGRAENWNVLFRRVQVIRDLSIQTEPCEKVRARFQATWLRNWEQSCPRGYSVEGRSQRTSKKSRCTSSPRVWPLRCQRRNLQRPRRLRAGHQVSPPPLGKCRGAVSDSLSNQPPRFRESTFEAEGLSASIRNRTLLAMAADATAITTPLTIALLDEAADSGKGRGIGANLLAKVRVQLFAHLGNLLAGQVITQKTAEDYVVRRAENDVPGNSRSSNGMP